MSIENLIQDLIVALNNNTAAHLAVKGVECQGEEKEVTTLAAKEVEATPKKTRAAKTKAPEPVVETPAAPEYTLTEVQELSSSLLEAEAIEKDVLKAKIKELGFNKMAEMSDDALAALYTFMLDIYNAASQEPANDDDEL